MWYRNVVYNHNLDVASDDGLGPSSGAPPSPPPAFQHPNAPPKLDVNFLRSTDVCHSIMEKLVNSQTGEWPPPCPVPADLKEAFEGPDGTMRITKDFCLQERRIGTGAKKTWSKEFLEKFMTAVVTGEDRGGAPSLEAVAQLQGVFQTYATEIDGKRGLVIGTELPWIEVLLLAADAAKVSTFEYTEIITDHPRLQTKLNKDQARDYLEGKAIPQDFAVSYSSIGHYGLGRYGDSINPDGDKEAIDQAWCLLKPGGLFFLALPSTCNGKGSIEFNAHRIYGLKRLAYITQSFEFLGFDSQAGCKEFGRDAREPLAVFRKRADGMLATESAVGSMMSTKLANAPK